MPAHARTLPYPVIPAQAGIRPGTGEHVSLASIDPGLHRDDVTLSSHHSMAGLDPAIQSHAKIVSSWTNGSLRFQKLDDLLSRLGIADAGERLHIVVLNDAVWIGDELVERRFIPGDVGVLHRL